MDFELPEDIRLLKDTMRRFVDRELIPIEMTSMDGPDLRPEVRAALEAKTREMGLWMLDTPEEYGGQGLSVLGIAVITEEIARSVALPPRGPGIFGPALVPILLQLSDEMKQRYLHPVLRGDKTTTLAQSEPDAGSDPAGMRTRAVREGDDYVVNGYKCWIPHAATADFYQLVAVTDPAKGTRGGLSAFIVDRDTPGITVVGETRHMMGEITYEVAFDNVRIPVSHRVGAEGDGMKQAQSFISANRIAQAARGVGVTARCLEMITGYARQRTTFGRPLADRQAVQFAVADLYTRYQLAQMLVYRTASRIDEGRADRHETYMAKIYCTELAFDATDRCLQFHGAMGLSTAMPIERMWRTSRSFMITGGPTEIMRATLAREIFKLYE